MICTTCDGSGEVLMHVHGSLSGWRLIPCTWCQGSGQITREQARWIREGARMRARRKAANRSQAEEAERLGIDVVTLSKMENGRLEPKEESHA